MNEQLRFPLKLYRNLAATTLALPAFIWFGYPIPATLVLGGLLAARWAAIAWITSQLARRSSAWIVTVLCVAEWAAALAITLVEGWAQHLTVIVCLGPVVLAVPVVNPSQQKKLAVGATVAIAVISLVARIDSSGPLRDIAGDKWVDAVAMTMTPLLLALVALLAWLNHRTLLTHRSGVESSAQRVRRAEVIAREQHEASLIEVEAEIKGLEASIVAGRDRAATAEAIKGWLARTQAAAARVRLVAHHLNVASIDRWTPEAVSKAIGNDACRVTVTDALPGHAPVVEAVARDVFADVGRSRRIDEMSVDVTGAGSGLIEIDVHGPAMISLTPVVRDRIAAVGGGVESSRASGGWSLVVTLPATPPDLDDAEPEGSLSADLRTGAIFPVAGTCLGLVLWLTVMNEPDMLRVVVTVALGYALPCLLAIGLSRRYPAAAVAVFVASHWLTAIVVVDQLNILKFFAPVVLLVPLLIAQPHVNGRGYSLLTIGTVIVAGVTIGIARLGDQIQSATDAPLLVTDVVVVVLVPLAGAIVMALSASNHRATAASAARLVRARRRLVEATADALRSMERDLHDGAQQRLVSAALRLRIASRVDDAAGRRENLDLAVDELASARAEVALLAQGRSSLDAQGGDLATALGQLGETSPLPLMVQAELALVGLSRDVETALWFCCSEAVTNAIKHAGDEASVVIDLTVDAERVQFSIDDDGVGFRPGRSPGAGLANIAERVSEYGGQVDVRSAPGTGTTLSGWLPVQP